MAARPVHRERPAPVMANEHDLVRRVELFEQPIDETAMLQKAIPIRIGAFQLFRVSHANEVRRDAAGLRRDMRHNIAPDIGRRRIAVQEDDRRPVPELRIGHPLSEYLAELLWRFFDGEHGSDPFLRASRASKASVWATWRWRRTRQAKRSKADGVRTQRELRKGCLG